MALFDTHKAVKTLTGAGFSENQAEALIDAVSEARGDAATNDDLQASEQALRADLQTLRADLQASDQAIRADMQVMEERLRKHIAEQLGKQTFQLLVAISALAGVVSGIVIAVLKLFP